MHPSRRPVRTAVHSSTGTRAWRWTSHLYEPKVSRRAARTLEWTCVPSPRRRHPSPRSKPTRRKPSSSASSRTLTSKIREASSNFMRRLDYNFEVRPRFGFSALPAVLFCLLISLPAEGAARRSRVARNARPPEPPPRSLDEALDRAARRPPARSNGLSVEIADLSTGEPVFARNPDAAEAIASVTKLFSTAAALHFLGPDYKFKTTFWRQGGIKDGVLNGPLLVVGGGNPNISGRFYNDDYNAVFDKWAAGLKAAGVTRVAGELILNDSFFDSVLRHPEWPAGQEAKWYQAPVSALAYNDGVVLVGIRPGARPGKPAAISIEPPTASLRALSSARTVGRRGSVRVAVGRAAGSNAVTVSGTVPMRGVWWSTPLAVDDPAGFFAEQTFKTLAAEKAGKGTWENAVSLEKQFLASLALDPTHFNLRDGSGL